MGSQQEFWEKLKVKYEEKNRNLQEREQELRLKLEAMDSIIGDCNRRKTKEVIPTSNAMPLSSGGVSAYGVPNTSGIPTTNSTLIKKTTPTTNYIPTTSTIHTTPTTNTPAIPRAMATAESAPINNPVPTPKEQITSTSHHQTASVDNSNPNSPSSEEKTGIFHCFFSLFGSSKGKPPIPPTLQPASSELAGQAIPQELPGSSQPVALSPSPPAPQDVPTKDGKQFIPRPELCQRKKRCMDDDEQPSTTLQNIQQQSIGNGENCTCDICNTGSMEQSPCNGQPGNTPQTQNLFTSKELCQRDEQIMYKNENCMCSPCEVEIYNVQPSDTPENIQQQSNTPTCDELPRPDMNQCSERVVYETENCICNSCEVIINEKQLSNIPQNIQQQSNTPTCDELPRPDMGQQSGRTDGNGDNCNCSVCSRYSIFGANCKKLCPCSFINAPGNDMSKQVPTTTSYNKPSSGMGALAAAFASLGSPSKLSLKSMDLHYMKNIHDLATHQKDLLKQVNDLEQKAKIYENVFEDSKNINFSSKTQCTCTCPRANTTASSDPNQKTSAELKLENFLLKNELKDMRLEVRQYLERMEGPMQFKIESERYKCVQLEQKLEKSSKELASMQELYEKQMNSLKMQLCNTTTNLYNLNTIHDQTRQELQDYQNKCASLENDLIRQKISEAETIKSLQAALCAQTNANVVKDECDLHQIARELSKILRECEPCGDCMNLPEDLTSAAKLLKSLTDMVDVKLNKPEEDQSVLKGAVTRDIAAKDSNQTAGILEINVVPEITSVPKIGEKTSKTSSTKRASLTVAAEAPSQIGEKTSRTSKTSSAKRELINAVTDSPQVEEQTSRVSKASSGKRESLTETPQIEEKTSKTSKSSSKKDSLNVTMDTPQIEGKTSRTSKSSKTQSVVIVETTPTDETGQAEEDLPPEEQSTKSETQNVGSKEELAKPAGDESSSQKGIDDKPTVETIGLTTKPKISCTCVKSKKSKEVDQLWPTTEGPITLKDSEMLDVPLVSSMKKKCDCAISKKQKAIEAQQRNDENQLTGVTSGKKICKCSVGKGKSVNVDPTDTAKSKTASDGVDQLWPKSSERFKLSHQVTASRSKELLKSETSIKCLKVKENFPFDIDTQVDVLNKPPDGVHVTTTITDSGTLEVITEGPEGVIETTLIYTNSGNVEVVTEILEYHGRGKGCKRGKTKDLPIEGPGSGIAAIQGPEDTAVKNEGAPEETTDVTVGTTKSGPTSINPDCRCRDCPVLELTQSQANAQTDVKGEDHLAVPQPSQAEPQTVQVSDQPAKPEDGANVNAEIAAQMQEITESAVSKQVADTDKGIVKSMSLTMHVENPDDITKVGQISDNSQEPPSS